MQRRGVIEGKLASEMRIDTWREGREWENGRMGEIGLGPRQQPRLYNMRSWWWREGASNGLFVNVVCSVVAAAGGPQDWSLGWWLQKVAAVPAHQTSPLL